MTIATSPPNTIDLRSDTSSPPTSAMREAIATAEFGNDLFGEDPTANALEKEVARRLGKEAAVLVPSGVMGNRIGLSVLAGRDEAVAVGEFSHINFMESAPPRRLVPVDDLHDLAFIEGLEAVRDTVAAIAIENTHMAREGHVLSLKHVERVAEFELPIHLDGARLVNAAVALGRPLSVLAAPATTVMFTLSKSLGAPLGSVLAGPADVMERAREERLVHGGGMAQAGIIGAAGLVAIDRPAAEIEIDHRRAAQLRAAALRRWPQSTTHRESVGTNIVMWSAPDADTVASALRERGVLVQSWREIIRAVVHSGITQDDIDTTIDVIESL